MAYFNWNEQTADRLAELYQERDDLLIDLDGTLLENLSPLFLWGNVFLMVKRFGPIFGWKNVFPKTKECLELVLRNPDWKSTTNYATLEKAFLEWSKISKDHALEGLWDFYRKDFPRLHPLTTPVPGAREGLDALRSAGKTLYLATNPIWPKECVLKRLEWANVPSTWFANITHSENWNVCKPSPLYYEKILTEWQLDPHNTLMIGNDVKKDGSSIQVGIPCLILPNVGKQYAWRKIAEAFRRQ
jgi:FMN phosphatase YigB (HAD superfamily)